MLMNGERNYRGQTSWLITICADRGWHHRHTTTMATIYCNSPASALLGALFPPPPHLVLHRLPPSHLSLLCSNASYSKGLFPGHSKGTCLIYSPITLFYLPHRTRSSLTFLSVEGFTLYLSPVHDKFRRARTLSSSFVYFRCPELARYRYSRDFCYKDG